MIHHASLTDKQYIDTHSVTEKIKIFLKVKYLTAILFKAKLFLSNSF